MTSLVLEMVATPSYSPEMLVLKPFIAISGRRDLRVFHFLSASVYCHTLLIIADEKTGRLTSIYSCQVTRMLQQTRTFYYPRKCNE